MELGVVNVEQFKTYKRRPGANDLKKEYLYLISAFYALNLSFSDNIDFFRITTFNANFGKFGELSIEITFSDTTTRTFNLHIEYKDNTKRAGKVFKGFKGSVSKQNINPTNVYVLLTNIAYENVSKENVQSSTEYLIFNTNKDGFLCKIPAEGYDIHLLANQLNLNKLTDFFQEHIQSCLGRDILVPFVHFMAESSHKRFVLTQNDIIAKLTELIVSPWIRTLSCEKFDCKTELIAEAIMRFHITFVENSEDEIITKIWSQIKQTEYLISKIVEKFVLSETYENASDKQKSIACWYLQVVPLVVVVDDNNAEVCDKVTSLVQKHNDIKLVFIGEHNFDGICFKKLSDLEKKDVGIYNRMIKELSGVGISLEVLLKLDHEFSQYVTVNDLLKISQDVPIIEVQRKVLPQNHISRRISTQLYTTDEVIEKAGSYKKCLVVISKQNFQLLLDVSLNSEVLIKEKCSYQEFEEICEKTSKEEVYLFEIFDETNSVLVLRKGSNFLSTFSSKEKVIESKDVFTFNHPLNVLVAPPGMGKSTLLQFLTTVCPQEYFFFSISLIQHLGFFKDRPSCKRVLYYFLGLEEKDCSSLFYRAITILRKNRRVHLFLDGLDEIDGKYVEYFLRIMKEILLKDVILWITSREHLRERIVEILNANVYSIKSVDQNNQKRYLREKLITGYSKEDVKIIVSAIYRSLEVASCGDILENPFHLYLLGESFLNKKKYFTNIKRKGYFLLASLFQLLLKGKRDSILQTTNACSLRKQLGYNSTVILNNYKILSLKSILDQEDFDKLNLTVPDTFLESVMCEGDKLGIIQQVTHDHKLYFTYQSIAKYFACIWFKENLEQTKTLRDQFFSKYQQLRVLLDIMVADDNPLHMAVIYQNHEFFEIFLQHIEALKHTGGRSVCHLASCYGESTMLKKILPFCQVDEKDKIFDLDCAEYARRSSEASEEDKWF